MGRTSVRELRVAAPAKINLNLRILGLRPDGYHEVESLMVPVDLADEVEIRLDPAGRGIDVRCPGYERLETEDNLAFRAADSFRKEVMEVAGRLQIVVRKNIPVASGLAGGTADAAAVLRGLCRLTGVEPRSSAVLALCERLGSDLPFCYHGRAAWVRGRGERLTPVSGLGRLEFCVVCPDLMVSTPWAYGQVRAQPLTWEAVRELDGGAFGRDGAASGADTGAFPLGLPVRNDLWEPVSRKHPLLAELGKRLDRAGCCAWSMSGSGPALFGLFQNSESARKASFRFREDGYWARACRCTEAPPAAVPGSGSADRGARGGDDPPGRPGREAKSP